MSRVLVDTSAYSAWVRGYEPAKAPLQRAQELYLSVVVLGELMAGFRAGDRREANEDRLRHFLAAPRVRVLGIDAETVPAYAAIYHELRLRGTPVGLNDVWIAATAYRHGLQIVTLHSDFRKIPQVLVDYIGPPQT